MRRIWRRTSRLAALLACAWTAAAATAEYPGWVLAAHEGNLETGYALYRSQQPGDDFARWRIEAELAAPADVVEKAALAGIVDGRHAPSDRRQHLLRREGDVYWLHTELEFSLVADRDVVLRVEYLRDPTTDIRRIEWRAEPQAGPPPAPGVVRLSVSSGFWEFTPAGPRRTHGRYESYAEPGGPFPSWLVEAIVRSQIVEQLKQLRSAVAEVSAALPPVAARADEG